MKAPLIYHPPETDPLPVLFVDDALLVVDKPAGLLSVPGRLDQHKDSMILRLQDVYPDALTVHRLDMDTSGLLVYARGAANHRALSKAFEVRKVLKTYEALVWGAPEASKGKIELPLMRDWPNRPKQKVDMLDGKPSETLWELISQDDGHARVRLTPVTGRTHQLRVHMAAIGHGILGDCFYGSDESMAARDRLCLHARRLTFAHPGTGDMMEFASSPPF